MAAKIPIALSDVQNTMLLPLWGRAFEATKPEPLLVDPAAIAMVDRLDYDFAAVRATQAPISQVAWVLRAVCIDEVVTAFLTEHPRGTVVNLGCGLDTTFERVDNGGVRWYDLDLEPVIALRRQLVQDSPRRSMITGSVLDTDWFAQVEVGEGVLFVAAGLLYYFEPEQVEATLKRLADEFAGCEFVFDVASPFGVAVSNKKVIDAGGLDERSYLRWGVADISDLLAWDDRFELVDTLYYFGDRAESLPPELRAMGQAADSKQVQYVVHLRSRRPS
ncbi:MAG: class I SAM-dependent methyltransferase [Propionibacteriales bacterium]|nr:class I SAM-dependent methyltransferase [Propionibacteriales bacterium]